MGTVSAAITVGVDGGDGAVGSIACYCTNTPSVVAIFCNGLGVLVHDADDIALEVLLEVIGFIIVHNAADAVFVVVQRDNGVVVPSLAQNLCAVEGIGVFDTAHGLARADAVGIVGIAVAVE